MTAFFDTNIIVYAVSEDPKGPRAQKILRQGGFISVQVLNETVNVLRRKVRAAWPVVENARREILNLFPDPMPITIGMHAAAFAIARDHGVPIYDALIVAAALEAGCDVLYSEDMQSGRRFGDLAVVNPFA